MRKRKLPISKGEKRIIETTVYYDPLYKAPDVRFDIDATSYGVFESEAGKIRRLRTSSNPGLSSTLAIGGEDGADKAHRAVQAGEAWYLPSGLSEGQP